MISWALYWMERKHEQFYPSHWHGTHFLSTQVRRHTHAHTHKKRDIDNTLPHESSGISSFKKQEIWENEKGKRWYRQARVMLIAFNWIIYHNQLSSIELNWTQIHVHTVVIINRFHFVIYIFRGFIHELCNWFPVKGDRVTQEWDTTSKANK